MEFPEIIKIISEVLKEFDQTRPVHKSFLPGIGPFGEPQIVKEISNRLTNKGIPSITKRTPDLEVQKNIAIEFKIVRPFGDNGKEAENWSVNMLHPYPGNTSLIGDVIKLSALKEYRKKGVCIIGFEHNPPKISLDPLINSFEAICANVLYLGIGKRVEFFQSQLVHPEHQVLRCIGWEVIN